MHSSGVLGRGGGAGVGGSIGDKDVTWQQASFRAYRLGRRKGLLQVPV